MRLEKVAALSGVLMLAAVATGASAQQKGGPWVDLGCKSVSFNVDRDVVRVSSREGRFRAIRVHARGGDVEMLDLKVIYGNNSVDDVQVRSVMKRGSRTRALDLQGWDRNIDRVEMIYRAVPNYKGREALVCIEGLPGKSAATGPWVDLGCKSVSFNVDRDVVRVSRREGRFRAIRVHARGGDVEILDLKVIYGNGSVDDVQVRSVMKRGSRTRALDLQGWERNIDRVEMIYRAVPSYRAREALVCIEGRQ